MAVAIITDAILMLITLAAVITSGHHYLTMLAAGILLILITARSMKRLSEPESGSLSDIVLLILCYLGAAAFSLLTGNFIGFLVFACIPCVPLIFVYVPACLGYVIMRIATGHMGERKLALMILELLLIIVIMTVILLIRYLVTRIITSKEEESRKLIKAGISELHEKKRNQEILASNIYAEKNARLIERENISRNIHNSVGHSITAAIMTLDAADMLYEKDPEAARAKMNDAGERIRGSLESIRSAVRALDQDSDDTSIQDFVCYVDNIIDNFTMDTAIRVDKSYRFFAEEMKIPGQHAEFMTGVLQELLTNGVKHGGATEFTVLLEGDSGHLNMIVKDNGKSGFNTDNSSELIKNGFGLKKIISYVERYGGKALFVSDDGNGFEARVEIPWQTDNADREEE